MYVAAGSTLILIHSVVESNTSADCGGGLYVEGGIVSVSDSTVNRNTSNWGGGIYKADGALTIERSTIGSGSSIVSGNVGQQGGGLHYAGGSGSATLIADSAVIRNNADSGGGFVSGCGAVTIQNVTISLNHAGDGGGIYAAVFGANPRDQQHHFRQ